MSWSVVEKIKLIVELKLTVGQLRQKPKIIFPTIHTTILLKLKCSRSAIKNDGENKADEISQHTSSRPRLIGIRKCVIINSSWPGSSPRSCGRRGEGIKRKIWKMDPQSSSVIFDIWFCHQCGCSC